MKNNPFYLRSFFLSFFRRIKPQRLHEVPGDRLALAVLVSREDDSVRLFRLFFQLGDDLLRFYRDDVFRLKIIFRVNAENGLWKVADMTIRRVDNKALSEETRNCFCFCW